MREAQCPFVQFTCKSMCSLVLNYEQNIEHPADSPLSLVALT